MGEAQDPLRCSDSCVKMLRLHSGIQAHTRHYLRSLGVDVKVAQELLPHANSRITLDFYTQAISDDKRDASRKHVEKLLAQTAGTA